MTKLTKKIVSILTSLTVVVMLVGPAGGASAMTAAELQAQIAQLQEQLEALTAQLNDVEGGSTPSTTSGTVPSSCVGITFSRNLAVGVTGSDVKCLQALLNTDSATQVAVSGAGSPGGETTYYGNLTKAGVIKFQNKYASEILASWGLTQGTGFFGSTSMAKANALLAAGTTSAEEEEEAAEEEEEAAEEEEEAAEEEEEAAEEEEEAAEEEEPTATGLTVTLASDTPAAVVLPDGSLYNSLLKIKFTAAGGSATVTQLDLKRGGLIANTNIDAVSVWDQNGKRMGNIITALTSDSKALVNFGNDDLVIASGESKTVIVKVNIKDTAGSGTLNFGIDSADDVKIEGDTTINGAFPITGNTMSIADGSASLGNVYVSAVTVGGLTLANAQTVANANVSVGDTGIEVAKFKFVQNNSLEAIQIEQLVVYVEGTINEDNDLGSWALYSPTGVVLATTDEMDDRYLTFDFADPYVLAKGASKTLTLKADILDGSTHYFRAQLQNSYDMMIRGVSTGSYLQPLNSAGSTFVDGTSAADANSYYGIKEGSLTVTKAAASPSGTVSPGDTDIVLAKFNLKSGGEDLEIRKMGLFIEVDATNGTSSGYTLTGSVKVQDADTGITYLSLSADTTGLQEPNTASYGDLSYQNLSTYMTIPSGTTKTINILGSVPSNDDISSSENYQVSVGRFYAKRLSSNDYTTLPNTTSYYEANQLDVATLDLTVNKNAAFSGKRVARGTNNVQIAEFVLGATAADDLKISTMKVQVSTTTGIQNVYLVRENGTQVGSTVGTPNSSGDSFTVAFTIPKSTTEVLKVFADVTTDAYAPTVNAAILKDNITGQGVNSSKSLDDTTPAQNVTSTDVTLGSATLAISKSASAPVSQIVVAGQTGVTLDEIDFEASYEDLTLNAITLELESASTTRWASATTFAQNFQKIYLYDGTTLLNTGGTAVSNGVASITGINVTLPADTVKRLTVKADISGSGALATTSVGRVMVDATSTTVMTIYSSTGLMSTGITLTDHARGNMFLFADTAISIATASGWGAGTRTGNPSVLETVGQYIITNTGTRKVTLDQVKLVTAISGAANRQDYVTTYKLYNNNDVLVATSTIYLQAGMTGVATSTNGATTTYVKFNLDDYAELNTDGAVSTEEIAAGANKTYTIKADTSHIEDGESTPGTVTVRLQTYMLGEKGYDSTDHTPNINSKTAAEALWKASYLTYTYTPSGGSAQTNKTASDSGEVYGATLSY